MRLLATQNPPYGTGQPPIQQTRRNYTGQYWDDTGLLYYNARYYDPAIGRFISADTIVPGSNPLTVWPGDSVASKAWSTSGSGPANPQDLNRYSYGLNNPVRNTDPSGHCIWDACLVEATLVTVAVLAVVAVAASPNSGVDLGDYDWTDWSIPALSSATNDAAGTNPDPGAQSAAPPTTEPASTLKPGPYAGKSIPARGPGRDFTPQEREQIDEIGRTTGCHTCGTIDPGTKSGSFIPDHQPPNQLNPNNDPQQLYPHCRRCSQRQGGEVNAERYRQQRPQ